MLEGFIPSVKRILPIVLVGCAFFVGAQFASAQVTFNPDGSINRPTLTPTPSVVNPTTGGATGGTTGSGFTSGGAGGGGADAGDMPATGNTQTEETPTITIIDECYSSPAGFLNCLVVAFFGNLVALAGSAFDTVINMFITGFGKYYIEYGIGYTVENIWGTIRDIFNLTFIFGLVYIGFQIILGVNESTAKRTIPLLIIAALLVNFSLFAVKFVVDFSNLAAVQVYNLFEVGDQGTPSEVTPGIATLTPDAGEPPSIALAFLNQMGVTGLLNSDAPMTEPGAGVTYMFTMVIIFLVLAYVFLAGAILITIRFAVLIFYMIFSPVMFLGWVFPGMSSYSKKFWQGLLGQAFFAPALLFLLYISYRVAQGFNDNKRAGGEAIVGSGDPNSFAIFLPYLIINVIFIVASFVVAKKMANQGADAVGKVNNWALGKMNNTLKGTGGAAAGLGGYLGYKGMDKMANSDNRFARGIGRTLTYAGARDKAEKAYKGSMQGKMMEDRKKQSSELAVRKAQSNLSKTIGSTPVTTADQIKFEQAITDASTSQIIKELNNHKPESGEYQRIVKSLSPSQVGKIFEAKDDEFSPEKKAKFAGVRADMVKERLTSAPIGSAPGTAKPKIELAIERDASADDLKHLGLSTLRENAAYITASKMDDLKSKLSPTEWGILNADRKQKLKDAFKDNPLSVFKTADGKTKKDIEIAKLPADILSHENSTTSLSTKVLEVILRENLLSSEDRNKIRSNIEKADGGGGGRVEKMKKFLEESPIGQLF